jgi:GNAT superfamily N-acetyltransferase
MTAIWNAACGPDLAIGERAIRYNMLPTTGVVQSGCAAVEGDRPAGFVLASVFLGDDPAVSPPELGWVDAIAVLPDYQNCGIGGGLLAWAERWLAGHGCTRFRLGGSLRPFAPGLPSGMGSERFFRGRGYDNRPTNGIDWDLVSDLRGYTMPPGVRAGLPVHVRPAQPGDEEALLTFLRREFPGRWRFEAQEFLSGGGHISDFALLLTANGVDGFCQLTFEDSLRPLDRYFMHRLPRPWGQLGPIGVSKGCRGMGYGAALLDAGLRRLRDDGVAGCVIDWTTLLEFYGKFGFRPYRRYEMLVKVTEICT